MGGFKGFTKVKDDLRGSFRSKLVNLAVSVSGVETVGGREYVSGVDLVTGRPVRATLSDWRTFDNRPTVSERILEAGDGGVLIFSDAQFNRIGTFEAFNIVAVPKHGNIDTSGYMKVSAPSQRHNGTWSQSIQHLRTNRAVMCRSYEAVIETALSALSDDGPGRPGVVIRGWDPNGSGSMAFEFGSMFDPSDRVYLDPETSFDAFLASPDIYVYGLNTSTSGVTCTEIMASLLEENGDDLVWEVIPKKTYSLGGFIAEGAGLGQRRDNSKPYRFDAARRRTGFLPSIIAFKEGRAGIMWPRIITPQRGDNDPIALPDLPTDFVKPETSPSKTGLEGFAQPFLHQWRRHTGMNAPIASPNEPPGTRLEVPRPSPFVFKSAAKRSTLFRSDAARPDLSAFDGIEKEDDDVQALSALDDWAAHLKAINI